MSTKKRATVVIAAILALAGVAAGGLHFFAENGQWVPGSMTNGATRSDQRDSAVSSSVR